MPFQGLLGSGELGSWFPAPKNPGDMGWPKAEFVGRAGVFEDQGGDLGGSAHAWPGVALDWPVLYGDGAPHECE